MTRTEYLTQLELYLKKLPEADRIEAMDYFRELFDDAGVEGEEELIASLGTPKEAAHEVLSNLLDKKINEAPAQKNNRQILHIALLALLAAPIGIPLGIAILVTLFAILVAALTVILAFFAVSILGIIGGFLFLVESFTILAQAKSAFILIFGSGLLAIGASSLVLLGISYVARFFGLLIVRLVQFVLKKGKISIYHIKHAYYGHIASINSRFPEQLAPLTLFSIISILVATTLFFFSFLLGSFVVRRFIHQEKDWTLDKVLQQYSQLLAIPIFLTAIASFFAFFDSLRFTALLCVISIGIILLASLHIITRPSQASETDSFYQLFLSVLVNGVIILLFFVAEVALIGDYLRILAFL